MLPRLVYSVQLLATAAGVAALAAYVWKRRAVPAAAPLLGLLATIAFWCIPCAFEPYGTSIGARLLWMRLELPSMACICVCYMLVAVQYTGASLSRRFCAWLFIFPAVLQVVAWTKPEWYWERIWIDNASPLHLTGLSWGLAFWCGVAYGYSATVVAIGLIIRQLVRSTGPRRQEAVIFLAATSLPVVVNIVDVLGFTPHGSPDLTPFAFGLTAAGITWVLFFYRFQAIVPVAWQRVFESMRDGVLVFDSENRVLALNLAAERMLSLQGGQIVGRPFRDAFATFPHLVNLAEVTREDGDVEVDTGGDSHIYEVHFTGLSDQSNQPMAHLLTLRDVTAARSAARELEKAKRAAEEANRAKSEFLANMSHQIRTPMNGVLGMIDLALGTRSATEQEECLVMARSSADTLLSVINDILDFSKIEAKKLELDPVDFDLNECVEEALRSFAMRAAEKGLELICEVRPEAPAMVSADAARLRQVLNNLVGNAVKFTHEGEVVLHVAQEGESDGRVRLHFTVSDTGVGVPADKQKLIFDPFAQADSSVARKFGGTGLGLTISSRLVQLMGGEIWVESDAGQGSRFHFTISARPSTKAADPQENPAESLTGIPVLLVEDNATSRRTLGQLLARWGMCVTVAAEGASALERIESAAQAGVPFKLVLAGTRVPGQDAFALVRQVKPLPGTVRPAIVKLASCGELGGVARYREMGVAACVSKPLRQAELKAALNRALRPVEAASPVVAIPSAVDNRTGSLRILLAEDNQINQHLAVRLLEKRGHQVTVAGNGRRVLELIEMSDFDLILMDVQMPEMDGFEATMAIRALEQGTGLHLPIIAMTANVMQGDRERCLQSGMDGYLPKPIKPETFFTTIEAIYPTGHSAPV